MILVRVHRYSDSREKCQYINQIFSDRYYTRNIIKQYNFRQSAIFPVLHYHSFFRIQYWFLSSLLIYEHNNMTHFSQGFLSLPLFFSFSLSLSFFGLLTKLASSHEKTGWYEGESVYVHVMQYKSILPERHW